MITSFPDEFQFELMINHGHLLTGLYGFQEVTEYLPAQDLLTDNCSILDDVIVWDNRQWLALIRENDLNLCMVGLTGAKTFQISPEEFFFFDHYKVFITKNLLPSRSFYWLSYLLDTDGDVSRKVT